MPTLRREARARGAGGLQNRSFAQPRPGGFSPPRCSSPLSLLNPASPQARPGAVQGAKRGEADPLTARTRPYNPALRERGVEGRIAAAEPPSIRALDSLIPGFFVSTGPAAPTTCNLLLVFYMYGCPVCTCFRGGGCPVCTCFRDLWVSGLHVENCSESHNPVEIGNLRPMTISGALRDTESPGRERTIQRGATVRMPEGSRVSRAGGSTRQARSSSSGRTRRV